MTLPIAWFATARGTSSRLLFEKVQTAIEAGELDAQIVVAFCNRERGQSENTDAYLNAVAAAGVPIETLSSKAWRERSGGATSKPGTPLPQWRHDFDTAVYERIAPYRPTIGVLAGYMLIATAALCERLPLLNLHPAEPGGPIGTWQEVIRVLIEQRAERSGMMIQRATTALDRGPIATWCRYSTRGGPLDALWAARSGPPSDEEPLFPALRELGVQREPHFLVASLRALADGRAPLPPLTGRGPELDLTADVERLLKKKGR